MTRFKDLAPDQMTDAQRDVYEEIISGPRGQAAAPHILLLQSPELADRAQRLGEFVRYSTSLSPFLSEFAILVTARHWSNLFEWASHVPIAVEAGIGQDVIAAIAARRRPETAAPDQQAVYDFCTELLETQHVGDRNFREAAKRLGERGVVELIGLLGYYSMLAMMLNTFKVPAPGDVDPTFEV